MGMAILPSIHGSVSSSSNVFVLEKHLAGPGQSLFPHTLTRTDADEHSYAVEQRPVLRLTLVKLLSTSYIQISIL